MASAICPVCERLVPIESRGYVPVPLGSPGNRRQVWLVHRHTALGDDSGGRVCDGSGRAV